MKIIAIIVVALMLTSCISMPPIGTIEVPVGNPPLGTASLSRVDTPAPGTRLGFRTNAADIGTDRVRIEAHEREIAVTVFDEPLPPVAPVLP